MNYSDAPFKSIDEYIKAYPKETQEKLQKFREVIHQTVPEATEAIKYGMPTFQLKGNLVHFAAFTNHMGFYPAPSGIEAFKDELSSFVTSKGAIQFPINDPIPWELVKKITKFRVKENLERSK